MKRGLVWLLSICTGVYALQGQDGLFKIVGMSGTGTQNLPESLVRSSFQRWLASEGSMSKATETDLEPSVKYQIRPALDFVVQSGRPSYVMAGLQLRKEGETDASFVASSSKIAYQWTTFDMTVTPNFRVLLYKGPNDGTDERVAFADGSQVGGALQELGDILSDPASIPTLEQGFHIISIAVDRSWTTIEKPDFAFLTCLATAEPDGRELFTLDEGLVEMTASSILQIEMSTSLKNDL